LTFSFDFFLIPSHNLDFQEEPILSKDQTCDCLLGEPNELTHARWNNIRRAGFFYHGTERSGSFRSGRVDQRGKQPVAFEKLAGGSNLDRLTSIHHDNDITVTDRVQAVSNHELRNFSKLYSQHLLNESISFPVCGEECE
jgi:hypothetical protein